MKGGLLLGGSQVVSQASSFLRNVIVARFLSPADFGIAAIFGMTLNFMDLLNMSYDKLLIQAEDGEDERFQATIHSLLIWRGIFTALLILACAAIVSHLFGVPQARWAFYFLALVPFATGLGHLDSTRVQRYLNFTPSIKVNLSTNLLTLAAAWPLSYLLRDYRAMLWIVITKVLITLAASHWVSERRYSCAWEPKYISRAFSFGWPLLINGFLMFGILQGDQFIIGSASRLFHRSIYSLSDLGLYSVAFLLTMAPTIIVANITSSLFLPLFARVTANRDEFEKRFAICAEGLALTSAAIAIPFILCGGVIVSLIYGSKYAAVSSFIAWLAVMQAIRVLRVGPNQAALARSDTKNTMVANTVRSIALVISLFVAWRGESIKWIAIGGCIGETLAFLSSVALLRKQHKVPGQLSLKPAAAVGILTGIAVILSSALQPEARMTRLAMAALVEIVLFSAMFAIFPKLRESTQSSFSDLLHWGAKFRTNGLKFLLRASG